MHSLKFLGFALVAGLALSTSCNNSNSSQTTSDTTATVGEKMTAAADSVKAAVTPDPNKSFVNDAVTDNTKELAWLQAGMDHGISKELKAHAKMMMADHQKLGDEVKAYASKKGIDLPNVDTAGVASLSQKPGKDWDKAWVDKMVDAHQNAIDMFTSAQGKVTDPDLKATIDKALPVLHSHYDMVKKMQDSMK
jgi:putative membrane protein